MTRTQAQESFSFGTNFGECHYIFSSSFDNWVITPAKFGRHHHILALHRKIVLNTTSSYAQSVARWENSALARTCQQVYISYNNIEQKRLCVDVCHDFGDPHAGGWGLSKNLWGGGVLLGVCGVGVPNSAMRCTWRTKAALVAYQQV